MIGRPSVSGLRGRSAKIVATLGPGSSSSANIRLLAEAGVDVFRLNFSHGEQEKHKRTCDTIRMTEELLGRPLAVLADLQGPKIRVGKFPGGELKLGFRSEFDLVVGQETDQPDTIPVPRKEILSVLEEGDTILADDGLLIFTVVRAGDKPKVRADVPGVLKDRKGFTVRGKTLPVPALSEKDHSDLAFALEMGVDIVALSFVQTVADIEEARAIIGDKAMIVAKLEKPAAIDNLDAIVDATDAVMIARGDLGVEFPPEEVPLIQRRIVRVSRNAGKPVIVATQMLESMIENAAPTRAEASDVATAIYQGADAVMLSAETAVGRHPATAVAIMNRIIRAVEGADDYRQALEQYDGGGECRNDIDTVAVAAMEIATRNDVPLALRTGDIFRLAQFSRVRGAQPILYGSLDKTRLRQAQLLWGIHAATMEPGDDWTKRLMSSAGCEGAVAYAAWQGKSADGLWAWAIGVEQ
ncbi:MAG: pyruvate kinase [Henriciella sp.]|jgi:pyruvate kinase|nr:pyruvate kinase [Henriciella sp.]